MKAIIKSASNINGNLIQDIVYDILNDDDQVIFEGLTISCLPSEASLIIKNSLTKYVDEYERSLEVTEGMEIS